MKPIFSMLILFSVFFNSCKEQTDLLPVKMVFDNQFGEKIEDPYRYVENEEDSLVNKWIDKQFTTFKYKIEKINKENYINDKISDIEEKTSFKITNLKITSNEQYFYLKQGNNESVAKLFYKKSFDSEEVLLYDPENFNTTDSTSYLINYLKPDWKGEKVAVSLTEKGKEISNIIVIETASKKVFPEVITNAAPSISGGINWLPNNDEFFYLRFNSHNSKDKDFFFNSKSVLHKVGTNPIKIKTILSREKNPNLGIKQEDFPNIKILNANSKYIIARIGGVDKYKDYFYKPVESLELNSWKPLFTKKEQIEFFDIRNDSLIYLTSKNAPNFKICKVALNQLDFEKAETLINESPNEVITDLVVSKSSIYFVKNKNGVDAQLYQLKNGKKIVIKLPKNYGDIVIYAKDSSQDDLIIEASGWTTKSQRFLYKNGTLKNRDFDHSSNSKWLNEIVIEEIEVKGHDGEMIPLSLIYHKDLKKDGNTRVFMDGYGAYGFPRTPAFSAPRLFWVKEGGIYAIAHVRGGGEKGDSWHKGGYKLTKPNTWKDFISCTEYLIDNKYTSEDKVAVWSGSAGGILIGRAITERPDLYKAAVVEFGAMNISRFEGNHPNGANNAKEFGSIKDSLEYKGLIEMDPYLHLEEGKKYPSVLLTAGMNDPRIPSWFSTKFAARLKSIKSSTNPVFLKVDKDSGHGVDNTKKKSEERYSDILAFALWQTGHPDFQPK